jgi:hypothetical protein
MDCFLAPLLAMTKNSGFLGCPALSQPEVFQIATIHLVIWGFDLRLRTVAERIAAESLTR